MESDHPGSDLTESTETKAPIPEEAPTGPPDPSAIVERLIESAEWPDPVLARQIVDAGEAAVGPLLDFMRTYPSPNDPTRAGVLYHAMGILGMIRSPAAVPVLVEVLRRYSDDFGEEAARVLGDLGAPSFEPALEVVRSPEMKGYARRNAIQAARRAAGSDPALRARLGEVLRPMLADAMDRTREEDRRYAAEPGEEDEDEDEGEGWVIEDLDEPDELEEVDSIDEDDLDDASDDESSDASPEDASLQGTSDLEPYEEVMFLVGDLASLADPEAKGMIKTAFAENLVDTFWIDEKFVEEEYREGGEKPRPPLDWLEDYRERHRRHIEAMNRPPAPLRPLYQPLRPPTDDDLSDEPDAMPPQEPIRNTGPKLGRNDPCWCGSGKKYKKCHWGKPGP